MACIFEHVKHLIDSNLQRLLKHAYFVDIQTLEGEYVLSACSDIKPASEHTVRRRTQTPRKHKNKPHENHKHRTPHRILCFFVTTS